MSKHTPGPWACYIVEESEHKSGPSGRCPESWFEIYTDDGEGNGDHVNCIPGDEESEANIRLVAAAPEMYEALKGILPLAKAGAEAGDNKYVSGFKNMIAKALTAIAKAEGRCS